MYIHIYAYMYVYLYIYIYTYICIHTCVYLPLSICVYMCIPTSLSTTTNSQDSREMTQKCKREFVMWCTEEAGIPKHEVKSIEYVDMRRIYGVQTAVIEFGNKGNRTKMSRFMMQHKAWNPLEHYSNNQTWEQHKITGRYPEAPDQRERRDYLNVAWQILKDLEGEERLKSDEGAYLNYPKASINDKADHLPLIQFIFEEITEGSLINPIARVYIERGFWDSDFEIRFRRHYEKEEEEEQETREKERTLGKEAPGSSTDYAVPHNMMRDREGIRTWKLVFHKTDDIEQHHPKFWLDVQSVADQVSRKGK